MAGNPFADVTVFDFMAQSPSPPADGSPFGGGQENQRHRVITPNVKSSHGRCPTGTSANQTGQSVPSDISSAWIPGVFTGARWEGSKVGYWKRRWLPKGICSSRTGTGREHVSNQRAAMSFPSGRSPTGDCGRDPPPGRGVRLRHMARWSRLPVGASIDAPSSQYRTGFLLGMPVQKPRPRARDFGAPAEEGPCGSAV